MKHIASSLLLLVLMGTGANAQLTLTVGDGPSGSNIQIIAGVTTTVDIAIFITNTTGSGVAVNTSTLFFSVGDGGPAFPGTPGTETIEITAIEFLFDSSSVFGAASFWDAPASLSPHIPDGVPVASITSRSVTLDPPPTNRTNTLAAFATAPYAYVTLDVSSVGLGRVGELIALDPDPLTGTAPSVWDDGVSTDISFDSTAIEFLQVISPVPEPSTYAMLALALTGGCFYARRRRRSKV